MAASNSTSGKQTKYYSLKAKVDETNTPKFVLSEKNAEGKWIRGQEFDTMSGRLTSAKIEEKEFEGAKFKVFVLGMDDDNESSIITLTHNGITHSLINSLASNVNTLQDYAIQVYKKKYKANDGDMKWSGGVSVKCDGSKEMQKWSIDPQSAPKKVAVMLKDGKPFLQAGKQVYDSTPVNDFWEKIFNDKIASVLGKPAERQPLASVAANNATANEAPQINSDASDDGLDLPF